MIDPEPVLKARLGWVQMYQATQNQALTCRRCGISKKTLRKWCRRYEAQGEEGLRSQSRRPHKLPSSKVTPEHEALILQLRRARRLGPKGLQRELLRLHQLRFSTRTIWKVLHKHGVSVLRPVKRPRRSKRYTRPVPGDRVQIDSCKVGKGLYQFTAIDDCTRMRVLALYSGRTAVNAAHFVREHLLKGLPFPKGCPCRYSVSRATEAASSWAWSSKTCCTSNTSSSALTDHERPTSMARSNARSERTAWSFGRLLTSRRPANNWRSS